MAALRSRRATASLKITLAAVSTVSAAYLAAVGAGVKAHPLPTVVSITALAAISLGTSVRAAVWEAFKDRIAKREDAARQQLNAAIFAISECTGIDVRDLSIGLFLVHGVGRWRRLERTLRIGFRPRTESTVRWTIGKGIVGECWQNDAVAKRNISGTNERWGECGPDEWARQVPETTRMNLTYEEWVKTRGKYDNIIAVPLHDDGRFVGCIALNGPANGSNWIDDREVRDALVAAAETIAVTVKN